METNAEGDNSTRVFRNKVDENTVQSIYDVSQGKFIVNSYFTNETPLSELIYQIIMKKENGRPLHIK